MGFRWGGFRVHTGSSGFIPDALYSENTGNSIQPLTSPQTDGFGGLPSSISRLKPSAEMTASLEALKGNGGSF